MQSKVVKCIELIQDLTVMNGGSTRNNVGNASSSVASVPHSPNGVLEAAACLSYKSDERSTVGSCPNSSSHHHHHDNSSPETKRKKLDSRTSSSSQKS